MVINHERRYTFANAAYSDILGLASNLIGQQVADVLASVYQDQIRPNLDLAFAGQRVAYELQKPGPNGQQFYSVRYQPTIDADAGVLVVVVITEITDIKRATEEKRLQLEELQRWHEAMLGREVSIGTQK